jgi:hypothetical protein
MTNKFYFQFFLLIILLVGASRFIYSTSIKENISLFNKSYAEKAIFRSIEKNEQGLDVRRSWGPISIYMITGIHKIMPKEYTTFFLRIILFISYGVIIIFLCNILREIQKLFKKKNTYFWIFLMIFISLQSSSAIYNITNGGVEIFTALSIIGHFYFFYKRKYFIAACFIIIGIYFKLHPIVFAFPYLVFSILSKEHKSYLYNFIIVSIIISIMSYPIMGFKYGIFYPLSMIYSIIGQQPNTLPIWSQEIFNPLSLINKILNGFNIDNSFNNIYEISNTVKILASIFTFLLFILNLYLGYLLSRIESDFKNDKLRLIYLLIFQTIIGLLYLFLSVDISIEHLLNGIISICAPIFLFSIYLDKFRDISFIKIINFLIYIFSLCFIGCLMPISFINRFINYNILDSIVNDDTKYIGEYGRYIWYHIPLIGLIGISFVTLFSCIIVFRRKKMLLF